MEDFRLLANDRSSLHPAPNDDPTSRSNSPLIQGSAFAHESKKPRYKPNSNNKFPWFQVILRIISLILSASIVGLLGHAVYVYHSSKGKSAEDATNEAWRAWPKDLKTQPTVGLLSVAAVATVLGLLLLLANVLKTFRHNTCCGKFTTIIISLVMIALWTTAGIYYKVNDWKKSQDYDMLSYVCNRKDDDDLDNHIGNLNALCIQLRYVWWAVIVIVGLEITGVVWSFVSGRNAGKQGKR